MIEAAVSKRIAFAKHAAPVKTGVQTEGRLEKKCATSATIRSVALRPARPSSTHSYGVLPLGAPRRNTASTSSQATVARINAFCSTSRT